MPEVGLDVLKDIPGYKAIYKAILKSQIQQLVEHLVNVTDEESVVLTASVADGTLTHLGTDSGRSFLEGHDDIKSQFLGFCLNRFHKNQQQEKEKEIQQKNLLVPHFDVVGHAYRNTTSSYQTGPVPVALTRSRTVGQRQSPYKRPLGQSPGSGITGKSGGGSGASSVSIAESIPTITLLSSKLSTENSAVDHSLGKNSRVPSGSVNVKTEQDFEDEDCGADNTCSGLSLGNNETGQGGRAEDSSEDNDTDNAFTNASENEDTMDFDPEMSIKLENMGEEEFEITGGESAQSAPIAVLGLSSQEGSEAQFDMLGVSGGSKRGQQSNNPAQLTQINSVDIRGGNNGGTIADSSSTGSSSAILPDRPDLLARACEKAQETSCPYCFKVLASLGNLKRHMRIHDSQYLYTCDICHKKFTDQSNFKKHRMIKHFGRELFGDLYSV